MILFCPTSSLAITPFEPHEDASLTAPRPPVILNSTSAGHSHDNKGGRPSFTDDEEGDAGGHSHSHGSPGGCCGAPYGCGGADAASMSMDPSGSYDEEAFIAEAGVGDGADCLLYTSPSPRDLSTSRMPSSA